MVDRYTKVCLTVIAVSLAVIGLRGLPMVGPAHADLDKGLELVGTYQLGYDGSSAVVLNTRSGFISRCRWMRDIGPDRRINTRHKCADPLPADNSRPLNLPSR